MPAQTEDIGEVYALSYARGNIPRNCPILADKRRKITHELEPEGAQRGVLRVHAQKTYVGTDVVGTHATRLIIFSLSRINTVCRTFTYHVIAPPSGVLLQLAVVRPCVPTAVTSDVRDNN